MFFVHRVLNAVTMMYNEAEELTACHFIRPSTYWKHHRMGQSAEESSQPPELNFDSEQEEKAIAADLVPPPSVAEKA